MRRRRTAFFYLGVEDGSRVPFAFDPEGETAEAMKHRLHDKIRELQQHAADALLEELLGPHAQVTVTLSRGKRSMDSSGSSHG